MPLWSRVKLPLGNALESSVLERNKMNSTAVNPVGVWTLIDSVEVDSRTGEISRPRGRHPAGMLVYTAGGRMCAIVTAEGRKPLEGSSGDKERSDYTEASAARRNDVVALGVRSRSGDRADH